MEEQEKEEKINRDNIKKIEFVDLGKKDINGKDEKDIYYGGELDMWFNLSDQYY